MNKFPDSIRAWIAETQTHHRILFNVGVLALGIVLIFGMNLLIARNFVGGTDFYINWSSAQQLNSEKQNPYEDKTASTIAENAPDAIFFSLPENTSFSAPIFSLFPYYPLSLLKDFQLARAIWMTILLVGLLSTILSLDNSSVVSDLRYRPILYLFIMGNVFTIISLLSGELFLVSLIFLLLTYKHILKDDFELAGIFCGLTMVSPVLGFIGMLLFAVYSASQQRWGFLIWFLITTTLLIFAGYLLLDNWIPYYLLVASNWLKQTLAIFQLALQNGIQIALTAISVLALIFEWFRFSHVFQDEQREKWLFNFSFAVIGIAGSILKPALFVLTLPAWMQISEYWYARKNFQARVISILNLAIYPVISIVLIIIDASILVGQAGVPQIIMVLSTVHLLVGMYWIRAWIEQDPMKKIIEHM